MSGEKPKSKVDNIKTPEAKGNELEESGIQTSNATEQPKIQVTKQPQKPQIQNINIHKHTIPSQPPNILTTPSGTKTKVNYNDPDLDNIRSLIRENEAAETLAQAGYKIQQNPKVSGTKNPDYLIENKIFDCYSPRERTNVRNIASNITRKIDSGQTNRIILNLNDWHGGGGDIDEIIKQLNEWPIPGLKEVKVINHYHVNYRYLSIIYLGGIFMATTYSILMKDRKLTTKILIQKLENMGYICDCIKELPKGIEIDLQEKLGSSIYLIIAGDYPYNSWITNFNEEEYIFQQYLECRFINNFEYWENRYKVILSLIFELMLDLKEEALLINNETELCMFKEDNSIHLYNKNGIWNHPFFRDIIVDKNIKYVDEL